MNKQSNMNKYNKVNNPDRVGKEAKDVIFLDALKGESLETVIEYWVTVNRGGSLLAELITIDNEDKLPIIKEINNKVKEIEILINKI